MHGAADADDDLSLPTGFSSLSRFYSANALPTATVQKLISELLPADLTFAKESRDLLIDCCVEFIHLVSSEANEICEKETKKTISADHVVKALVELGFEDYVQEIQEIAVEHKEQQKVPFPLPPPLPRLLLRVGEQRIMVGTREETEQVASVGDVTGGIATDARGASQSIKSEIRANSASRGRLNTKVWVWTFVCCLQGRFLASLFESAHML
jgi:histone H3/H4